MTFPFSMPLNLTGGSAGPVNSNPQSTDAFSMPFSTPFNFDGSGWNVTLGSTGTSNTATGNKNANGTTQSANPTATATQTPNNTNTSAVPRNTGYTAGGMQSGELPLIAGAIGLFLILSHAL